MCASRERFLRQLERCVRHQPAHITPGPVITTPPEIYIGMGEFIAPADDTPPGHVECDTSSVWGLRPPGDDERPMAHPLNSDEYLGDWA